MSHPSWWAVDAPLQTRVNKTLCGLEWKEPYWQGSVQSGLFRPEGLIVSGAPPGSLLVEWYVGNQQVLPAGAVAVFLSAWSAMDEIESRIENRCPARPHFPVCEPHMLMRLKLVGPAGELLGPPCEPTVWGLTPSYV